jgi:hypothetical protein
MNEKAFQDYYPENVSYCYGCSRQTSTVCRLKVTDKETVCLYTPDPTTLPYQGMSMVG